MPTDLISIGRSGAAAARASLEVSAQNIANASNPDYARRRIQLTEFVATATIDFQTSSSLSGVRIGGIQRPDSELIQRRARDSSSDLSRAEAEINALRDAEAALEQSRVFEGLVDLEAALTLLESDPTDPALRTGALETARQLSERFEFAVASLSTARDLAVDDVIASIGELNGAAQELARVNRALAGAREGTAERASLLDARDAALRDIAGEVGIVTEFDDKGVAEVRLVANPATPGEAGILFVSGTNFGTLSSVTEPDGSLSFTFGGSNFRPVSGAMAGRVFAIDDIDARTASLDDIAVSTITRANNAQSSGAALDGSPGQPLFSGTDARSIAVALTSGDELALAPAGSPAGSRDTSNLSNLIASIGADDGPIRETDRLLLSLSSRIAGLDTTREGLSIINASAEAELLTQTGVDLDAEAAALVRLQQAFEANSRIIQVANDLFDTILGLR
jgi:flagellar hook-associated protein 1 FlgK